MSTQNPDDELLVYGFALVAIPLGFGWLGWLAASTLTETEPAPSNPITMVIEVATAETSPPPMAIVFSAIFILVAVVVAIVFAAKAGFFSSTRDFDRAARRLRVAGLKPYLKGKGPKLGRRLGLMGGAWVRMTHESTAVIIAGPRTGKTTGFAIPMSVNHRGPLIVTSNKRDIADTIWLSRSEQGAVHLFDPQSLAPNETEIETTPGFWWNPLSMAKDLKGARRLAKIWIEAERDPQATPDAYFDVAGAELLANMLLTASLANKSLSIVYSWLSEPGNPEPVNLIGGYADYRLVKESLENYRVLPDKQRAGVYSTALKTISWLAEPSVRRWCTASGHKPHFDVAEFVSSTDTLISLSREGEGSATPLVTALTAAVLMEAEAQAARQPGGRLQTELLALLDEAANVCRWQELPNLYSHYGSRGILIVSIFQSWAQLVDGFGKTGAEKLWNSANAKLYLGGSADDNFLKRVSELCGKFDEQTRSASHGRHGRSTSRSYRQQEIFDIASLAALPTGRALVMLSAARPVVLKTVPWWDLKESELIERSIHTPRETSHV